LKALFIFIEKYKKMTLKKWFGKKNNLEMVV